jgi:hypothetical protein
MLPLRPELALWSRGLDRAAKGAPGWTRVDNGLPERGLDESRRWERGRAGREAVVDWTGRRWIGQGDDMRRLLSDLWRGRMEAVRS